MPVSYVNFKTFLQVWFIISVFTICDVILVMPKRANSKLGSLILDQSPLPSKFIQYLMKFLRPMPCTVHIPYSFIIS
jgi:hypothetical protein